MYDTFPTISVIVPTLNEANNLPLILPHIPMDLVSEVIIVDGHSTDGTVEIALACMPAARIVIEKTPGKGAALRAGYRAATGEILIVLDADGSNDPREITRYIRALLEGADFVKGSRFAHNGGTTDMPRYRKLGNAAFVHMVNVLFDTGFTDLCYGYHAFWRYSLDLMNLDDVDGFEIDTALYLRAVRERLRISEVPSFEGYRFYGEGKLRTIPDGWRVLKTIASEWWTDLHTSRRADYHGFRGASVWPLSLESERTRARFLAGLAPGSLQSNQMQPQANLELLQIVRRMLSSETNRPDVLRGALHLTLESMGAASGSLVVLNDDGNVTEGCVLQEGQTQALESSQLSDVVDQGFAGWVLRHGEPALVESTLDDPRWLNREWEDAGDTATRSALGVPLIVSERVVGVLTLTRPDPQSFTEEDMELVARHAVAA